jgi:ABC-type lipoprotein release transport system permease subunit
MSTLMLEQTHSGLFRPLPGAMEGADGAAIAVASPAIAAFATIYPARQATRLIPVDAIRQA